jgi:hypothetical protein
MSARAIFHLFLHAAVPALLAWLFWRKRFASAWLLMLLGWIIDLDHLLADPIYAPNRCSIGFHRCTPHRPSRSMQGCACRRERGCSASV